MKGPGLVWGWVVWGWLFALLAAALPALWLCYNLVRTNPMNFYVDPLTGEFMPRLYWRFLKWWISGAVPVSLLALACLFLNRNRD